MPYPGEWLIRCRIDNLAFTEPRKSVTLYVVPRLDDIVDRTPTATRSFIADDETAAGAGPIDRAAPGAARILRYQLNVVASSTEEVVQSAGGWLCDHARAGWDVNVLVSGGGDPRPLMILEWGRWR
jgi:hypothetical protein